MSLLTRNPDLLDPLDAEIAGQPAAAGKLEIVAGYVRSCQLCGLYRDRKNAVPGEGDPDARLMIIGEGPGEHEDLQGRPFVGKSGELLEKILDAAGLQRKSAFITNIVKCRPAEKIAGKLQNRIPFAPEVNSCRPYLVRQVEIIQPRVILCLGAPAARAVIDGAFKLTEQRGNWYDGPFGSRMMATFHPAFILRQGGSSSGVVEIETMVHQDFRSVAVFLASQS